MITPALLRALCPDLPLARCTAVATGLQAAAAPAGITTPARIAAFVAQLAHESVGYQYLEEIWGPTPAQIRYQGRTDLGNTQPGDGYRYRGRGWIQLTGRFNYRKFGKRLGLDLEGNPDLAARPDVAAQLAVAYWSDRNLNALADVGDFVGITQKINGGTNGLADRQRYWGLAQAYLAKNTPPAQRFVLVDKGGVQADWNGRDNPYNTVTLGPELLAALDLAYPVAGGPWEYGGLLKIWRRRDNTFVLERLPQA